MPTATTMLALTKWKAKKAKDFMAPQSRWQCRYGEMRIDLFREPEESDTYCLLVRHGKRKEHLHQHPFKFLRSSDEQNVWSRAAGIIFGWVERGILTPTEFRHVGVQPAKPIEITFEDADGNPRTAEDVVERFSEIGNDKTLADRRSQLRQAMALTLRGVSRMDLNQLWTAVGLWSDQTFGSPGGRGPVACLRHMKEEAKEAAADPWNPNSYASLMLLLLDATRRADITWDELIQLTAAKLRVCRTRNYPKPQPGDDTPCHYIREDWQATSAPAGPPVEDA